MKGSRTWVLLIGIGVAIAICVAAFLAGAASTPPFSMIPKKKPLSTTTPAVLIEKTLKSVALTFALPE